MTEKSILAEFFRRTFSTTYKREDWCYLLRISNSAISQWCNDTTIPSPDNLRAIIGFLRDRHEEKLLGEFEILRYKNAADITPNHSKLKARTLNDYLLNVHFGKLLIEIDKAPAKLKEDYLNVLPSFVYNSGSMNLDDEDIATYINEIDSITKSLKYRLASLGDNSHRLCSKLIDEFRLLDEWLKDTRPIPDEFKFWSPAEIDGSLEYDQGGIIELFNIGQKYINHQRSNPTLRIYALDGTYFHPRGYAINDLIEIAMIIPFNGAFSLSQYDCEEESILPNCTKTTVMQASDSNSILPRMMLSPDRDFKGVLVLFSSKGVLDYKQEMIDRDRSDFHERFSKFTSNTEIREMYKLINRKSKPIPSTAHETNREQGILKTLKKSKDLFDGYDEAHQMKWEMSLIEICSLRNGKRIKNLYKHDGLELIIPLNNVEFNAFKCGLKSSELSESKIDTESIGYKDIFRDSYRPEGADRSGFRPLIVFDPNTPHAFLPEKQKETVQALHIYLRNNVDRVLKENESLNDSSYVEREKKVGTKKNNAAQWKD